MRNSECHCTRLIFIAEEDRTALLPVRQHPMAWGKRETGCQRKRESPASFPWMVFHEFWAKHPRSWPIRGETFYVGEILLPSDFFVEVYKWEKKRIKNVCNEINKSLETIRFEYWAVFLPMLFLFTGFDCFNSLRARILIRNKTRHIQWIVPS